MASTIKSKTELADDETAFEITTLIPLSIEMLHADKINHNARYDHDLPIISSPEIDLLVDEYEDGFVEGNTMETLVENSLPPNSQPTKTGSFYTQESNTELPYHEAETMTLVHKNLDFKPELNTIEPNLTKKDKKPRLLDGIHKSSSELSDDKISFDNESETTTDSFYTQESNTELPYHEAETMTFVQENLDFEPELTTMEPNSIKNDKKPRLLDRIHESSSEPMESDSVYAQESNTELPYHEAETMTFVQENLDFEPELTTMEPNSIKNDKKPRLLDRIHESSSEPMESDSVYAQESNTELPYHEAETMTLMQENLDFEPESTTIEPNLIKNDKKPRLLDGIQKSSSELSDYQISFDNESETTTLMPELVSDKINNVSRTLKPNEEITKDKQKVNKPILTGPYFGPYLVPFIGSFFGLHYHTWNLNQSSKIHNEKVNNGTRLTDNDKNSGPQMGTLSPHYGSYFGIYYLPFFGWHYLLTHNTTVESEDPDIELLPDDYLIDLNNKPSFASK